MICEHHVTTQPLTATARRHAVVIFDGGVVLELGGKANAFLGAPMVGVRVMRLEWLRVASTATVVAEM